MAIHGPFARQRLADPGNLWSRWLTHMWSKLPNSSLRRSKRRFLVASLETHAPVLGLFLAFAMPVLAEGPKKREDLWSLQPLLRPEVPQGVGSSPNPIDAFIAEECRQQGLSPLDPADKLTWLRRVSFDLTGLPPSLQEQDAWLADESAGAAGKVVDRLLSSEQHGVRYGRHWLDVLRYSDVDENMPAAPGIHLWRDWVVSALNQDLPYDAFVRVQICGNRDRVRTTVTATGHRVRTEPRPEDLFALGFLARGATERMNSDHLLAISAVETISSAFLGMTVGCAKCHDHFYDPIKQADFYSMKALFDPLVLRSVELATAEQRFVHGRSKEEYESRKRAVEEPMNRLIEPYRSRLYEERLQMLPPEVQAVIRKPEKTRTADEQKIADDYYPILRIDPPKIKTVMSPEEARQYDDYLKQIKELTPPEPLPVFWTVEEDAKRAAEKNFVLITGDPKRPKSNQEVQPGFPFGPEKLEFREGRRETFVDWLTAPENPLFARVAVNRIWQWHFGTGLHASASDWGALGGKPTHPKLLDWLSSEFIAQNYSMKWLHRLIVTSETYRRASAGPSATIAANQRIDPDNRFLWRFPVRRLEAEPIRDAVLMVAGKLDLTLGGKSFESGKTNSNSHRRAAYMMRGFRSSADITPDFLTTFDAEDGRATCPRRNQTVTAPQALFMMNNELLEDASACFAERLQQAAGGAECAPLVTAGFRTALGRSPTESERVKALEYIDNQPERIKGFAWLLLNLDEFMYLR